MFSPATLFPLFNTSPEINRVSKTILYLSTVDHPVFLRYLSSSLVLENAYWFVFSHPSFASFLYPGLFSVSLLPLYAERFLLHVYPFFWPFSPYPQISQTSRIYTILSPRLYSPLSMWSRPSNVTCTSIVSELWVHTYVGPIRGCLHFNFAMMGTGLIKSGRLVRGHRAKG